MENFGPLAGYQLQETQRAIGAAEKWKANATEWRSYAEGLQRDLERSLDQRNGAVGVRIALVDELKKHFPESNLVNPAGRSHFFCSAVNAGRVERGLAPLSEQELAKL